VLLRGFLSFLPDGLVGFGWLDIGLDFSFLFVATYPPSLPPIKSSLLRFLTAAME